MFKVSATSVDASVQTLVIGLKTPSP